jgi:6-phosphofructokinase 2
LPPGVSTESLDRVAKAVADLGARLVVDTSGPALRQLSASVFLLKPSLRELTELTGRELRTEADESTAARALIAAGRSEAVVLSLGERGALVTTRGFEQRLPPFAVSVRSSVGAGDSMVAGIVLALARGKSISEAVRFGMAAGAAALLNEGTQLCRREDVERLYASGSTS